MIEGTAVIYQVGDRVKYYDGNTTDFGTIIEVDGSKYTEDGRIWALWDNTNIKQYSKPKYLTLIERKQAPKPKFNHEPFKYAAILKHWADGGEIQFEDMLKDEWITYANREELPCIGPHSSYSWRIKPEVKSISYRVGITKDNQVKVYHKVPTLNDSYSSDAFKDWLDPEWRSVEVEV